MKELRTVREWLFDYFSMIEGTQMAVLLAGVADREVETFAQARAQVNNMIDMTKEWLDNTRPTPSFVYEPAAFLEWREARGKELPPDLKEDLERRSAEDRMVLPLLVRSKDLK